VVAALCLATDLAMGLPFEHGLHATRIAVRLGELLAIDPETASETYYVCLLSYCGCTADAEIAADVYGGDLMANFGPVFFGSQREMLAGVLRSLPDPESSAPVRAIQIARRLPKAARSSKPHMAAQCEVGEMLAERLGLPNSMRGLFFTLTDRWDGEGPLGRARRDEIPLAVRIANVAGDAAIQHLFGGVEHAAAVIRERAGGAFDPQIAGCLADNAGEILTRAREASAWEETLASEPHPWLTLEGEEIATLIDCAPDQRALPQLGLTCRPLTLDGPEVDAVADLVEATPRAVRATSSALGGRSSTSSGPGSSTGTAAWSRLQAAWRSAARTGSMLRSIKKSSESVGRRPFMAPMTPLWSPSSMASAFASTASTKTSM
jgi:hypothetical protein